MNRRDYFASKIVIPKVPHTVLPRHSITALINSTPPDTAVCFVAPYGYGKTSSTLAWLQGEKMDAVWVSLDDEEYSEQVASLSAAMLRMTGWQGDAADVLSNPRYSVNPLEYFWESVTVAENSACDRILVLDNFQALRDREFQRTVKAIVSELIGRWRVIIMSRAELPPVFAELILKGQICMVTPKELGFGTDEMMTFFTANGCTATEDDITGIKSETEGWPAALNVISMVSRGGAAAYNEAARTYVNVFFETEIWDSLDDNIKDFLLRTSILDKLSPANCRAVSKISATLPVLQGLFTNGLFISQAEEKDTYICHRVFRSFLLNKLDASDIDKRELYRNLGWWLFDNHEITRSFPCFFEAEDLYGISQVLRIINPANMGGIDTYLELMNRIVELDIQKLKPYPVIVARIAMIHFLTGDIAQMQSLCKLLVEWNASGELTMPPDEYAEFLWEIGWLYFLDPDEATAENEKHREWVGKFDSYAPQLRELQWDRTAVLHLPSILRGTRDYGDDGIFQAEPILKQAEAGEISFLKDQLSLQLTYLLLAEYHYECEKFAEAESIVRNIMPQAEDRHLTFFFFMCAALLTKIIRAVHDPGEIDALEKRTEAIILNNGHAFLLPNFHAFQTRNRLASGQTGFTEAFENENKEYEDKPYFFLLYRHFTLVRGLLSICQYSRAMLILGNLELLCQRYKRPTDLIEVNILKAVALYNLGYEEDAGLHLRTAINAAERYGFIRMFSDEAKNIWPVLEKLRKRMRGKHIQNIVISCKKTLARAGQKPSAKRHTHMELTKAELKVLRAVRSGMSYIEIAQDNGVRLSTIKSQLHSIYAKLEANNKTEAIITAQSMGILS